MNARDDWLQLRCPTCSWTVLCDDRDMVQRLLQVQMLRRQSEVDPDLVRELFQSAAQKLACDECGTKGVIVEPAERADENWGEARACDVCGQSIAAERIELFPDTRLCTTCQALEEKGQSSADPEYCPRCGSIMQVRPSKRSGLARYELVCEQCRRQSSH